MRYKHLKVSNTTKTFILVVGFCLGLLSPILLAYKQVERLQVLGSKENTRLILDLSQNTKYKLFTLENPYRIVIDFEDTRFKARFNPLNLSGSGINKIRHAVNEKGTLRIVLDMQSPVKPESFLQSPTGNTPHRLIVDLKPGSGKLSPAKTAMKSQMKPKESVLTKKSDFIVAIDPGHGGEDTGAIGQKHQVREKDVVFAVSKQLKSMINAQAGMKAYLVRNGDYYVGLRKRMALAREQGADLFISVHADAFQDQRASGASVYVLSEKGASNEAARWLAERENRSDLIGGVSLDDKNNLLASVLLDLSQTASQTASYELGAHIIDHLEKVTDLHHKTVQSAGFAVLKSPDIPSVLVELGFISNLRGEEKLLNPTHQRALAMAIMSGVKTYAGKRTFPSQQHDDITVARK